MGEQPNTPCGNTEPHDPHNWRERPAHGAWDLLHLCFGVVAIRGQHLEPDPPDACGEIVNKRDHMEGFVGYRCNQSPGHEGPHALRWFITSAT